MGEVGDAVYAQDEGEEYHGGEEGDWDVGEGVDCLELGVGLDGCVWGVVG